VTETVIIWVFYYVKGVYPAVLYFLVVFFNKENSNIPFVVAVH